MTQDMCVNDFEFFVITKQKGLGQNTGILGLSPPIESQNGPSYVKNLYNQGVIEKEVVTFWLNYYNNATSYVTFGEVPANSSVGETFSQDLYNRYD
jgi:hypothetical protein